MARLMELESPQKAATLPNRTQVAVVAHHSGDDV